MEDQGEKQTATWVQTRIHPAGEAVDKTSVRSRLLSAKQELLEIMIDKSKPLRLKMLNAIGNSVKEAMVDGDPDMPPLIRRITGFFTANVWEDIERLIEEQITSSVYGKVNYDDVPGPSGSCFLEPWYRIRAFVLYHFLPHDKSMFGRNKDPVYLVMLLISCLPVSGVRTVMYAVILFMLLFPGRPDEYQLINFVLLVKGFQFLTSGLMVVVKGAIAYYVCYTFRKDRLLECMDHSLPASSEHAINSAIFDYLGSIVLPWIAFVALKWSVNSVKVLNHDLTLAGKAPDDREMYRRMRLERCYSYTEDSHGGRMWSLLFWDMTCFALTVALLLLSAIHNYKDVDGKWYQLLSIAQFRTDIFWCSAIYSLLTLPFLIYLIPGVMEIFTHSHYSGYNRHGACVSLEVGGKAEENYELDEKTTGGKTSGVLAYLAVNFFRTIERGQKARGADTNDRIRFRDFGRGMISAIHRKLRGVGWRERRTEPEGRIQPDATQATSLFQNEPSLVAAVRIPRVQIGHPTYFFVEVEPFQEAGEHVTPWLIKRRYDDFYNLAGKLGQDCQFQEAPFPGRARGGKLEGQALEARRVALELWLSCAIRHPLAQDDWEKHLRDFLTPAMLAKAQDDPHDIEAPLSERSNRHESWSARSCESRPTNFEPHWPSPSTDFIPVDGADIIESTDYDQDERASMRDRHNDITEIGQAQITCSNRFCSC